MNFIDQAYEKAKTNTSLSTISEAFDSSKDILVTVNVEVFNHAKYLRQCLDSILSQKVSFNVVIHIHDDASTDDSKKIIEEYRQKYPNIVFPIIQAKNVYSASQKENDVLTIQGLRVRGKYVAMCEGDDYWTDRYKLETQVSLMEQCPSAHLCLHTVKKINNNTKELMCLMPQFRMKSGILYSKSFIKIILKKYAFQTSSYFFKSEDSIKFYSNLPKFADVMPTGDETMIMYYGQLGDIIFINKPMSVYRKFADGSWSLRHRQYSDEINLKINLLRIESLKQYDIFTNYSYHKFVLNRIYRIKIGILMNNRDYKGILNNKELCRYMRHHYLFTYIHIRWPKFYRFIKGKNNDKNK